MVYMKNMLNYTKMLQKFINSLNVNISKQFLSYGSKTRSSYSKHKSSLPLMEKYICRLFCSESKNKIDVDPELDQQFDDLFKKLQEEKFNSKIEKKEMEMEKMKSKIFEEISNGDPNIYNRLISLSMEVSMLRERDLGIPIHLTKGNYEELLVLKSFDERTKYLHKLYEYEMQYLCIEKNKEFLFKKRMKEFQDAISQNAQMYFFNYNCLFTRLKDSSVRPWVFGKLYSVYLHSPQVVFDCSYEGFMAYSKCKRCAYQIQNSYLNCLLHPAPLHVKLCNFHKNSNLRKQLIKINNSFENELHPWDFHEEDYMDLYDHKQLVYLTPDSTVRLNKFNADDVYIIGVMIDNENSKKESLAKATRKKLRVARIPLELSPDRKNLNSNVLGLDVVYSLLLDFGFYNSWNKAFSKASLRSSQLK